MSQNKKILEQMQQQANQRRANTQNPPTHTQVEDSKIKAEVKVEDTPIKSQNIFYKLLMIVILLAVIAGASYHFLNQKTETVPVVNSEPQKPAIEQGLAEYNTALSYYNNQKWVDAYDNFNLALKLGYNKAKYYLGMLYFGNEQYTTLYRNRAKSFEYLSEFPTIPDAIDDGLGYYYLGYMYMTGQGTERNISAGEAMYEKSFENARFVGVFIAKYGIAQLYYNGFHGVPVDKEKAKRYFDRELATTSEDYRERYNIKLGEIDYDAKLRRSLPTEARYGDECKRVEGSDSNPQNYYQEGEYSGNKHQYNN